MAGGQTSLLKALALVSCVALGEQATSLGLRASFVKVGRGRGCSSSGQGSRALDTELRPPAGGCSSGARPGWMLLLRLYPGQAELSVWGRRERCPPFARAVTHQVLPA